MPDMKQRDTAVGKKVVVNKLGTASVGSGKTGWANPNSTRGQKVKAKNLSASFESTCKGYTKLSSLRA